jgi:hypothetical protein
VRSLDEDNWMFAAPRSRINLVSRPGKKGNTKIATDGFLISFFLNLSIWPEFNASVPDE